MLWTLKKNFIIQLKHDLKNSIFKDHWEIVPESLDSHREQSRAPDFNQDENLQRLHLAPPESPVQNFPVILAVEEKFSLCLV